MKVTGRVLLVLAVVGATFALASPTSAATSITVRAGSSRSRLRSIEPIRATRSS